MKRRWEETSAAAPSSKRFLALSPPPTNFLSTTGIIPSVNVIFEGRSICHSVRLDRHASYESLAATLRRLFVGADETYPNVGLDLSNAVPGHMVVYEDMEDDLLLAGDLSWKDFVRVVRRIRIIPARPGRRKHGGGILG
ncbi:hypothetical protein IEQ34_010073 [Dendrobium chrysotoxum]|uniref:Auxin-responsive protein n=1 Tax=Dendrobium chrysotoxum TaxID=161865 RepID=A0AAV7H489_DENCH|nr:hypothetical protein IEQ34_010073 [Dendrobium chrysotoxum]